MWRGSWRSVFPTVWSSGRRCSSAWRREPSEPRAHWRSPSRPGSCSLWRSSARRRRFFSHLRSARVRTPEPATVPAPEPRFEPRLAGLIALAVYLAVMLTLCWPVFQGQFLGGTGSDQFTAGYSFRLFGAEMFKATGHVPLWNPYLFGGMPFVGAMHGDIFYPTAWLRLIMPVCTAMGLAFAAHIVLAGIFAYLLLRALRLGWTAAF